MSAFPSTRLVVVLNSSRTLHCFLSPVSQVMARELCVQGRAIAWEASLNELKIGAEYVPWFLPTISTTCDSKSWWLVPLIFLKWS